MTTIRIEPKKHTMAPKNNRLKPDPDIASPAEFFRVLDQIAQDQLAREQALLDLETEINQVRERYEPVTKTLGDRLSAAVLRAEKYATIHRETLFGKTKSASTALTLFGFRLGQPTLKLLNSKWKWETVIAALKANKLDQFVVVKETPDKDGMKANLSDDQLALVGTRIDQTESFFVEPKREEKQEPRIVTEGKEVA